MNIVINLFYDNLLNLFLIVLPLTCLTLGLRNLFLIITCLFWGVWKFSLFYGDCIIVLRSFRTLINSYSSMEVEYFMKGLGHICYFLSIESVAKFDNNRLLHIIFFSLILFIDLTCLPQNLSLSHRLDLQEWKRNYSCLPFMLFVFIPFMR